MRMMKMSFCDENYTFWIRTNLYVVEMQRRVIRHETNFDRRRILTWHSWKKRQTTCKLLQQYVTENGPFASSFMPDETLL